MARSLLGLVLRFVFESSSSKPKSLTVGLLTHQLPSKNYLTKISPSFKDLSSLEPYSISSALRKVLILAREAVPSSEATMVFSSDFVGLYVIPTKDNTV